MILAQATAKLQSPQVSNVYYRKHLFAWLNQARKQPAVWISAGAGSGKTTLVASYLKESGHPTIWYQVDSGDEDIASFFFNLGLAGKKAGPKKRKSLPLFTPEYAQNLSTFTRNFFRAFYGRLPQNSVIVLDNYESVSENSDLHEILRIGLEEILQDLNVFVISRQDPPPVFARLRACGNLPMLHWADLHLSRKECAAIIRLKTDRKLSEKELQTLYDRTNGWVAGLVLAIEELSQKGHSCSPMDFSNHSLFYDYFDKEIFRNIDPACQEFMLKTAIFPQMTIRMAKDLSGIDDTEKILNFLVKKNFFTVFKPDASPSYVYHDLFRSFLNAKAADVFNKPHYKKVVQKAASLLKETGQDEYAVELYHRSEDWQSLLELVINNAQALLEKGKVHTLEKWIGLLPEPYRQSHPWILHWMGACRISLDPLNSRKCYEKAFHLFRNKKDPIGTCQSWAGIIESYIFFLDNLKDLGKRVKEFMTFIQEFPEFPDPEIEVRVVNCMISALVYCNTHHEELTKWAIRAKEIIKASSGSDIAIKLNGLLIPYCGWIGKFPLYRFVVDLQRDVLKKTKSLYLSQLKFYIAEAHLGWLTAEWEVCDSAVTKGKNLSKQTGIRLLDNEFISAEIYRHASSTFDIQRLDRLLVQMESYTDSTPSIMRANIYFLKGWIAFVKKDMDQAFHNVDKAMKTVEVNCGPPFNYALSHLAMVYVQLVYDNNEKVEESLHIALTIGNHIGADNLLYHGYCLQAYQKFKNGSDQKGLASLKKAMAVGSNAKIYNFPWWSPKIMTFLCQKALENGIEPSFVSYLIQKRDLFPKTPPLHIYNWPWPVKIYTLGKFSIFKKDEEIRFSGKAQKKPIDLLKSLLAFGSIDVPVNRLADALWPDSEGDAAYQSFTMALKRLRKLLGGKDTIILSEGLVSLNPRICWTDIRAFEFALEKNTAEKDRLSKAVDLYKGPFLAEDTDSFWAAPMQIRQNHKYLAAIKALAKIHEKSGDWDNVIDCYEKGLDADDLSEPLYRELMSCYERLGQMSQVVGIFDRCKKILRAKCDIEPSRETIDLYRKLIKPN